ncbi:MAG: phenylacetate--CoA ligase family protein [Chloroflexi bacterium]|nr:phenylacetate--CoA ligase family protein [Chloroflexota bacterium]
MRTPVQRSSMYPHLDCLSREEVESLQLKKLRYQLEYVYQNSSFYRRWLDSHKVHPEDIQKREDIRKLPFMTKKVLLQDQLENPPYGNRLCVSEDKIQMVQLTSGTSGLGQEVYSLTRMDVEYGGSAWARWLYATGLRKGDRFVTTWPLGTNNGPQGAFLGAYKIGANTFPLALYDSKAKLQQYMVRYPPHGLLATPAYLTHLTILCQELGIDPRRDMPDLKAIWLFTEAYPLEWAEKMEEFWNTRIFEGYGSTQQGAVAGGTCERGAVVDGQRGFIHLDEHGTVYEVLDRETGGPVKSGEEGELVVTNLHREGSPLIRFKSDDRVTFMSHEECSCGRPFVALQAGTIARYDDMIKMKVQNVWPEAVDAVVFSFEEVEEYNGRVFVDDRGREEIDLLVEFKNRPQDEASKKQRMAAMSEEVRRVIGVTMNVREAPHGSLERFIFKTRRWTDERRKGLERVKYTVGSTKQEKDD